MLNNTGIKSRLKKLCTLKKNPLLLKSSKRPMFFLETMSLTVVGFLFNYYFHLVTINFSWSTLNENLKNAII